MKSAGTMAVTGFQRRDAPWLAIAVALHAALLLLPLRDLPSSREISRAVSVTLFRPPDLPEAAGEPPVAQPLPDSAPVPEARRPRPADPEAAEPPPGRTGAGPETGLPSAAALMHSLGSFDWPAAQEDNSRRLGAFTPRPVPENWRPRITVEDNRFDGLFAPAETEVVDRWLAADGSHRVVVNSPDGNTYCGRARAWDPMQPLVEPVMNWWKCAGGGERTFRMPERFMRPRHGAPSPDGLR